MFGVSKKELKPKRGGVEKSGDWGAWPGLIAVPAGCHEGGFFGRSRGSGILGNGDREFGTSHQILGNNNSTSSRRSRKNRPTESLIAFEVSKFASGGVLLFDSDAAMLLLLFSLVP